MHTYTINTHTIRGEPVSVTAPIIGYHQKTGAAVPGIPQMNNDHWEDLAKLKGGNCHAKTDK